MKSTISIFLTFFSLKISAQTIPANHPTALFTDYTFDNFLSADFSSSFLFDRGETSYLSESERLNLSNHHSFTQPSPPILTTSSADLELCTGNSTRLTASSNHIIYWYTSPPPLGTAVGTGSSYITPALTSGYYTYYAVAENNGIRSEVTAMEVVMVYPSPTLLITSTAESLCATEAATLTASGTTYYEWENGPVSTQIIISPSITQSYKVTGINTAGCRSTVEYVQLVEACKFGEEYTIANKKQMASSSEVAQEDKLFSVFPNPNNGTFTIRVGSISENTKVEIYNWLGQLTYSFKVTSELNPMELTNSPNGIYIVRILEGNKIKRQQKIVLVK